MASFHDDPNALAILSLFLLVLVSSVEAIRPGFVYTRNSPKCTPKYWSSRKEEWPRMVPQTATVANLFGSGTSERYRSDLTVGEATAGIEQGDAYRVLAKQASAALLNSYAREGFPYTPWAVKTLVIGALVSEDKAYKQAQHFKFANEACV